MYALDGNAIGGMLEELFGRDMTAAVGCCGGCGARGPLAECMVYRGGPGVVVRCRVCQTLLMAFVRVREIVCIDLGGLSEWEPAPAA